MTQSWFVPAQGKNHLRLLESEGAPSKRAPATPAPLDAPASSSGLLARSGGVPTVGGLDIEGELARFEAEQRARLGLSATPEPWIEKTANLTFTKAEKSRVTLLIGGLTIAHDVLVQAALTGLGYNVIALDCPDYDALRVGKEFGNRAQCNPTYFTVGNLVKFLIHLRDERGMKTADIINDYVFLTAGACGPCRFGMYVTEYRKALRDAGFEGFRVTLFQQQGGLDQASGEDNGLELTPRFFVGLLQALLAGDVLNALAYRLRPYEVEPGATDRAVEQAKALCRSALQSRGNILLALYRARRVFAKVQVDRTRCKPRVAIIGEFWAMTTEGDGNYRLQRFLEEEGAECDVQLITAWLLYNIWEVRHDTQTRAGLRRQDGGKQGLAGLKDSAVPKRLWTLRAAETGLRLAFQAFANTLGLHDYHLPDMDEVARVAGEHYDNDLRGGEGHMEVGKLILNVIRNKATMTLSVKPFGCMPSSGVSDGVQSLVSERFPGTIFCAVETSGDGAVNFQSRVQMYLHKAKQSAQRELAEALSQQGLTWADVQAALATTPRLRRALHRSPHTGSLTAVDLVNEIGARRARGRRAPTGAVLVGQHDLVARGWRGAPSEIGQRLRRAAGALRGRFSTAQAPG